MDARLKSLGAQGLRRSLPPSQAGVPSEWVTNCHDFASNDYLGLAEQNPDVSRETPIGSGASRLVTTTSNAAACLEAELAQHVQHESALLFTSGYAANVGTLGAIIDSETHVFSAESNHASLIDGIRLAKKKRLSRYPEHELNVLDRLLTQSSASQKLVVTEAVFSMDGSVTRLEELSELVQKHGAWLMVDEAHSYGLYGADGAGLCAQFHVRPEILIGTLGKALGSQGAFVAADTVAVDYISQRARSFVFSTGVSPLLAEATQAQLRRCKSADAARQNAFNAASLLREKLTPLAETHGLRLLFGDSLITSLVLNSPARTMNVARELKANGFLVGAIRPPTVPAGSSRLRIVSRAVHHPSTIEELASALERALSKTAGETLPKGFT